MRSFFIPIKLLKTGAAALFAGCLLTSAFAPFNCLISTPIAFYILLHLIHSAENAKKAAIISFIFGLGYFFSSLYSFSYALTVEGDKFKWMIPFAAVGLPAILSLLFVAPVGYITFFGKNRLQKALIFAHAWFACEMIRSFFFWPFPWNIMGYVFAGSPVTLQLAWVFGLIGCTYIVCLASSIIFSHNNQIIGFLCLSCVATVFCAEIRLVSGKNQYHHDVKLLLVQPNLDQPFGKSSVRKYNYNRLTEISQYTKDGITHVIWPEAALPYALDTDDLPNDEIIKEIIPKNGSLIMGVDRVEKDGGGRLNYYNSVMAFGDNMHLQGVYDKEKLVPFGEYVPLRNLIPFVDKITHGMQDFKFGNNPNKIIKLSNGLKVAPLVCYEIIFPNILNKNERPDFILNVTNEKWFEDSNTVEHMLAMAQFRAAEYGVPVVRVANHAYTGVIDPYGRIYSMMVVNDSGALISYLPKPLKY